MPAFSACLSGNVRLNHWLAAEAMSAAQSGLVEAMVDLDSGKTFTSLKGEMGNANYEVVWMNAADGRRLLRATGVAEKRGRTVRKVIEYQP
ncbi:MAG: hypothetical protein QGF00_04330 [Planctomycetota bacterium]|nr:hypothetical protein [Planctomycetota bacterium]